MSYRYTLADARTWPELAEVANVCPTTSVFAGKLNTAMRRAMKRGGWFDTEQLVRFCIYDQCLTLPDYVQTLLGVRTCHHGPMEIQNHWYAIIGPSHRWGSLGVITELDSAPVITPIGNTLGSPIRYSVVKRNDIGKTIKLYGTQYGGQPLQEKDANGVWQPGITLTAAAPFAQTSVNVTHITSITRQATEGMAYLYEVYDVGAGTLRLLDEFKPYETNPRYRRYRLDGIPCACSCTDANGRKISSIEALVKLAFVPVVNEGDFLLIDDPDALAYMFQAIDYGRQGDAINEEVYVAKAMKELNMADRNALPKEQTPVTVISGARGIRNLF